MTDTRRQWTRTAVAVVIVAVYLFPVYWMVATSFKTRADIFAVPPALVPLPPVFDAYRDAVLDNPILVQGLVNSAIISIGTTVLTLMLAAPAAYGLTRLQLRFGRTIVMLVILTQLLPAIILAGPLFVIFSQMNVLNNYLTLIVADTVVVLPFAIIILRPFLLTVPTDLEDAAKVDGCNRLSTLWRIILPIIRPGLITVAVFAFLLTWGEFVFGLTLMTDEARQPVTVVLNSFVGQYGVRWNDLMAVATTIALPIIVIFASLQRFIAAGLTAGATKE